MARASIVAFAAAEDGGRVAFVPVGTRSSSWTRSADPASNLGLPRGGG